MTNNEDVPDWLIDFFTAILNRKTIEKVEFYEDKEGKLHNFICCLEHVFDSEVDDEGEWTNILFSKLNMSATVYWEGNIHEVL